MKNLLQILLAFSLFFVISTVPVIAQEATDSAIVPTHTPTPTPPYQLPYAGLLPDNPLYNVKMFRDKIVEMLISDPVKKAEFDILQADKRLSGAVRLSEQGKWELAETTLSKSQNYFDDAVARLREAKKMGRDISAILSKLNASAQKHAEEWEKLQEKVPAKMQKKMQATYKRFQQFQVAVSKISLQ